MRFEKIDEFYQTLVNSEHFNEELKSKLQKRMHDEKEYKVFIQNELIPLAKSMGYDLSVDDILSYEHQKLQNLSEEELESVIGGTELMKNLTTTFLSALAIAGGAYAMHSLNSAQAMALASTTPTPPTSTTKQPPSTPEDETPSMPALTKEEIENKYNGDKDIKLYHKYLHSSDDIVADDVVADDVDDDDVDDDDVDEEIVVDENIKTLFSNSIVQDFAKSCEVRSTKIKEQQKQLQDLDESKQIPMQCPGFWKYTTLNKTLHVYQAFDEKILFVLEDYEKFMHFDIEHIVLDNGITKISSEAFVHYFPNLKNISGEKVTTIEEHAFDGSSVETANFPMAKTIKRQAFYDCSRLKL